MDFDAVIIGGGPAGAAAGEALAAQGRSVAIVERSVFPRRKVCGEFMSATNIALLDQLGIGAAWRDGAGPQVRRVGLFSGERMVSAAMPRGRDDALGRAIGRDVIDGLLLAAAQERGATLFQPWRALDWTGDGGSHSVLIRCGESELRLRAPVVIAAHGSWEPGALPSQAPKDRGLPSDLLGFKAHFTGANMPADLMPLLVFPGGYGGMVWADQGRLSLSCCIRRGALAELRRAEPGAPAAACVFRHITRTCRGVRQALSEARLSGPWLAAGPIRPGFRRRYSHDFFRVGNAAGEAHPIIAEGISMALQSGWLLARHLDGIDLRDRAARAAAGTSYATAWRRQFGTRIVAAAAFAKLSSRPAVAHVIGSIIAAAPSILTVGARLSGKTRSPAELPDRGGYGTSLR